MAGQIETPLLDDERMHFYVIEDRGFFRRVPNVSALMKTSAAEARNVELKKMLCRGRWMTDENIPQRGRVFSIKR